MYKLLFKTFILSGTLIMIISYIATFYNPLIAAIFLSYPFSVIPTIYYMKQNNKSNDDISKFLFSTTLSFILLLLCTFTIGYFFKIEPDNKYVYSIIIKSTILWCFYSLIFYLIVSNSKYKKYFIQI